MTEEQFPQEGPRTTTGGQASSDDSLDQNQEQAPKQAQGQVSEVQRLDDDDADTPISPGDSTAGYPDSESGSPDTAGSGPDAAPPENRHDNEYDGPGKRHPGESIGRG